MGTVWFPLLMASINLFVAGVFIARLAQDRKTFFRINCVVLAMNLASGLWQLSIAFSRLPL